MNWHEITIRTTEEAIEMISNFLHEMGAGGVAIEESGTLNKERDTSFGQLYDHPLNDIPEGLANIQGYFAEPVEINMLVEQLSLSVERLKEFDIDVGEAEITTRIVNEEDWANAWKQYYKPVRISDRITIKPTWEIYERSEHEIVIELDPGMAFGTGTHPTTALCLRALEKVIQLGDDVVDVGTGSGVLAIAASMLGGRHVLALDLDPVAVISAQENVLLNQLENRITVLKSDLLQALRADSSEFSDGSRIDLGVKMPVQLVVANILAEIIILFVDDVYEALMTEGHYIVSGIIKRKEQDVVHALTAAQFIIVERYYEQDWVAIVARKVKVQR